MTDWRLGLAAGWPAGVLDVRLRERWWVMTRFLALVCAVVALGAFVGPVLAEGEVILTPPTIIDWAGTSTAIVAYTGAGLVVVLGLIVAFGVAKKLLRKLVQTAVFVGAVGLLAAASDAAGSPLVTPTVVDWAGTSTAVVTYVAAGLVVVLGLIVAFGVAKKLLRKLVRTA